MQILTNIGRTSLEVNGIAWQTRAPARDRNLILSSIPRMRQRLADAEQRQLSNITRTFKKLGLPGLINEYSDEEWFTKFDERLHRKIGHSNPIDVLMFLMIMLVRLRIIDHFPDDMIRDTGPFESNPLYEVLSRYITFVDDPNNPGKLVHIVDDDIQIRWDGCVQMNRAIQSLKSCIWLLDRPDYPGFPTKLMAMVVFSIPSNAFEHYIRAFIQAGMITRSSHRILPR